jgi:tRNA G18 (ribose-2'-O)-methylase SpoU
MKRGYWGLAIYKSKTEINVGTLWRTGHLLGASFFATIGRRYKHQASDTMKSCRHIPLFEYTSFDEFKAGLPKDCQLIAIELSGEALLLDEFNHPDQACYLLGAEDEGLPENILNKCHAVVKLRGERSMNVAVAGSIVAYHRGL